MKGLHFVDLFLRPNSLDSGTQTAAFKSESERLRRLKEDVHRLASYFFFAAHPAEALA